jgi:hypothetical protein
VWDRDEVQAAYLLQPLRKVAFRLEGTILRREWLRFLMKNPEFFELRRGLSMSPRSSDDERFTLAKIG